MSVFGPILVFLANGTQGSAVVRAARRRGHSARALIRTRSSDNHADAAIGDLDDPASLIAAAQGCAHAVLQVPTGEQSIMVRQVEAALDALGHAGVRSIVLKLASASRPAPCTEPSFVANATIEALVRRAGIPFAVVRPTMYLDNLLKPSACADIAERGVFSPPIAQEQEIAWTCANDCAEATIQLLEKGVFGGDHRIAGSESVTGDQLAQGLSAGFDRTVSYHAQPIADFEREVDEAMGEGMGSRIASKFRYFRDHPGDAQQILADPFNPAPPLADFVPTTIAEWARQHAERFR